MEVLPDSSTMIALAKIGSLDLLKRTFSEVRVTKEVEEEITAGDFPEIGEIKRGIGGWIKVLEAGATGYKGLEGLGECVIW